MVMAETGEDEMVFCSHCTYAANLEKAEVSRPEELKIAPDAWLPAEEVHTPDVHTIDEVCSFLNVLPRQVVKTLIFTADGRPVAVLVRGDDVVNEIKVKNFLGCDELEMAMDDVIYEVTRSPRGFAGAVGIKARTIADYGIMTLVNMVMGANREDYHLKNINYGRDFDVEAFADLRKVKQTDPCPRCGKELKFARGIEVGHVFKLGRKYSQAMKAVYLDRDGKEKYMVMGCYGIGIGRTVAAAIEQNHDNDGIIWPMPLAPYQVMVTPVNINEANLAAVAEEIYDELQKRGVEAVFDDRDERAGVKFKDADLIGIPLRVTIGPRRLAEGSVEVRLRQSGKVKVVPRQEAVDFVVNMIQEAVRISC
jgi:prolyl-tRNA synthetase